MPPKHSKRGCGRTRQDDLHTPKKDQDFLPGCSTKTVPMLVHDSGWRERASGLDRCQCADLGGPSAAARCVRARDAARPSTPFPEQGSSNRSRALVKFPRSRGQCTEALDGVGDDENSASSAGQNERPEATRGPGEPFRRGGASRFRRVSVMASWRSCQMLCLSLPARTPLRVRERVGWQTKPPCFASLCFDHTACPFSSSYGAMLGPVGMHFR